nr:ORF2 [Torque teno Leptonychotes weddellii virus 2]WCS65964.1 ORF2 [Torque teno Leptonychotes weddellii virus 2]WCS65968.1 ORF2 [Torque teno Leptonychotes weddellii virus 2]WCS66072.1 ORF2 [Torque teno Leptonychotes weddellii virus 2]
MSAADSSANYPDFSHPRKFRQAEAAWKKLVSRKHKEFCSCPNFLDHFRWPGTGGNGTKEGDTGDQDTGAGSVSPVGATGGGDGEGDISDIELLR